MMKYIIVFLLLISFATALKKCNNPSKYYGKYINHIRAYKCKDGTRAQCVGVLFELCKAPNTGNWRKGLKVIDNCKKIPTNTPIASFTGSGGKYNGSNGHAGIFLGCDSQGNIQIADQWCGHKFSKRTLKKRCASSNPVSNCASYFYTAEW